MYAARPVTVGFVEAVGLARRLVVSPLLLPMPLLLPLKAEKGSFRSLFGEAMGVVKPEGPTACRDGVVA